MMSKKAILATTVAFLATLGLTITFGTLMYHTDATLAQGTLRSIDSCFESCYVDGTGGGCTNSTVVSFDWTYQNTTYNATQFQCSLYSCTDCCYQFVNHTILVEIDSTLPFVPIRFWTDGETPYSIPYYVLFIICVVILVLFSSFCIMKIIKTFTLPHYQQLD